MEMMRTKSVGEALMFLTWLSGGSVLLESLFVDSGGTKGEGLKDKKHGNSEVDGECERENDAQSLILVRVSATGKFSFLFQLQPARGLDNIHFLIGARPMRKLQNYARKLGTEDCAPFLTSGAHINPFTNWAVRVNDAWSMHMA